jgi:predicted HTH domain antitoxin
MKKLTIEVPEQLDWKEQDVKRFLAAKLFEAGELTLGQGADMAGLSKTAFSEILADYQVSLINYSADSISKDASRI